MNAQRDFFAVVDGQLDMFAAIDSLIIAQPAQKEIKMGKHVYTATLPDGSIIKRTTDRTYTHVIACSSKSGQWSAREWCGRADLAEKAFRRLHFPEFARIIPVNNPR